MTLDDYERPKRTLMEKLVYGDDEKYLNEGRPILSAAKCSSVILVSINIRFARIFAGIDVDCGAPKYDSEVLENADAQTLRNSDSKAHIIIQ